MNFSQEIISWYNEHKRELPWRNTHDPYIIWLSEIIMQQTRIEQGLPYFIRFIEEFPTVSHFAAASEDKVLNLWQGLGYYSRGRNMHFTANVVMEEHEGYFPTSYAKLIKLKGIGEYTAAAISSFSANEVKAVVDGNVFRLLSRYFGIDEVINSSKGKRLFFDLANDLIDPSHPGLYNQAIMEFGSLQCRYKKPDCFICPLRSACVAYRDNRIDELPVKLKKQPNRNRYFNYIVAKRDEKILLNKRGPNDIWQNLHEFPLFETAAEVQPYQIVNDQQFKEFFGESAIIRSVHQPRKHMLSHQNIYAIFIEIENFDDQFIEKSEWFYASHADFEDLALPKLIFENLKKFV